MKWTAMIVCAGCASIGHAESTYSEDFARLKQEVPAAKMKAHLAAWQQREPNNPDASILSANWHFEQARGGLNVSTKPAEDGDLVVADPKTGTTVGSLDFNDGVDAAKPREAIAILRDATKRFPGRLDIHCGLAHMLQESGLPKEQFAALQSMAKQFKADPTGLRWCHGEELAEPAERFVARKLHAYAMYYYRKETPSGDAQFQAIAKLASEACPNQPEAWNDLAIHASLKDDRKSMQKYLEKAAVVAPSDSLVLLNLADNSAKLGLVAKAQQCYQRVIALNSDTESVALAQKRLSELGRAK